MGFCHFEKIQDPLLCLIPYIITTPHTQCTWSSTAENKKFSRRPVAYPMFNALVPLQVRYS